MLWLHTTIFIPNEWLVEASQEEVQNKAYGAGIFSINHVTIRLRVAKVTPKKTGQLWCFGTKTPKTTIKHMLMTELQILR